MRSRFHDFIESLRQPHRKYGVVCFLLAFLCADFLFAAIYFLYGFFALKTIGPAAEMATDIATTYKISVYVDTSEYLYWSIPFFIFAVAAGVALVWYAVTNSYLRNRAKRSPVRQKERIRAKEGAEVAVRVKAVDPDLAKTQDLYHAPPAWLTDPLAVVTKQEASAWQSPAAQPVQQAAPPQNEPATPYTAQEQPRRTVPVQPFTYSDFVRPAHSVSAPHNSVQRPSRKNTEIPYAGSLQYIERTDKKKQKKQSPYAPDQY